MQHHVVPHGARARSWFLGPIDRSKLGFTLPHEHIFAGSAGVLETWPALVGGRTAFRDRVVDKLKALKAQGVDTIVDVTPSHVGRDVPFLEDVSRRSGVQIVACTNGAACTFTLRRSRQSIL